MCNSDIFVFQAVFQRKICRMYEQNTFIQIAFTLVVIIKGGHSRFQERTKERKPHSSGEKRRKKSELLYLKRFSDEIFLFITGSAKNVEEDGTQKSPWYLWNAQHLSEVRPFKFNGYFQLRRILVRQHTDTTPEERFLRLSTNRVRFW